MMDISLIVCTRNRAEALSRMLATLEKLRFSGQWEAVLVDNGSTDRTTDVLRNFAANTQIDVRLAFESRPGLAAARNCGIRHSRGALLAFTDDDCYPDPDLLARVAERLSEPSLAYCGGQVLLFDPTDRPVTIQTRSEPRRLEAGTLVASGTIHGANMAFRREALLAVNGFDERLGAGTFFKSGEDTDLLSRLSLAGYHGYYDPAIRVHHHHGRKTIEEEKALRRGYDRGVAAVFSKMCLYRHTRRKALKHLYWHSRTQTFSCLMRQTAYAFEFARRNRFSSDRAWHHPAQLTEIQTWATEPKSDPLC